MAQAGEAVTSDVHKTRQGEEHSSSLGTCLLAIELGRANRDIVQLPRNGQQCQSTNHARQSSTTRQKDDERPDEADSDPWLWAFCFASCFVETRRASLPTPPTLFFFFFFLLRAPFRLVTAAKGAADADKRGMNFARLVFGMQNHCQHATASQMLDNRACHSSHPSLRSRRAFLQEPTMRCQRDAVDAAAAWLASRPGMPARSRWVGASAVHRDRRLRIQFNRLAFGHAGIG